MAQRPVFLVAFALVLVAVSAIPVKFIERDEVINKPAGPHCKLYNTSAECIDDKCCNWFFPALSPALPHGSRTSSCPSPWSASIDALILSKSNSESFFGSNFDRMPLDIQIP